MASSYRSAAGPPGAGAGLCGTCAHARRVVSSRGSRFVLCARSVCDAAYPRYPRVPVLSCAGHEPASTSGDGSRADDENEKESDG